MRIVVLGAGGGVGRHAVRVAAERGHEVVAGARSPDAVPQAPGVERLAVDVRDRTAVELALQGADALLWCVGVTKRSGGDVGRSSLPTVLEVAAAQGVSRVVAVSGAGVTLPDDRKGLGARLVSGLARRLGGDLVRDKEGEHAALAASSLSWTAVRPPRLVERPGTGRYALGDTAPGLTAKPVAKADVALAMVELAEGDAHARRAPFLTAG